MLHKMKKIAALFFVFVLLLSGNAHADFKGSNKFGVLHNKWVPLNLLLPTIQYNFLSGLLDSSLTFSRAGSATYYNSSGILTTAATNVPRFDYNPSTLTLNGLLLEESRTNSVYPSVPTTGWNNTAVTFTANAATSPDGTSDAVLIVEDTTTNNHQSQSPATISVTSGSVYTYSAYLKYYNNQWVQLYTSGTIGGFIANFDLINGVVGTSTASSATIKKAGNGWYYVSITFTASSTATTFITVCLVTSSSAGKNQSYAGDGVSGTYIYGTQSEAGAFPTSYIPTTSAAVTRAVDSLVNNSIPWFNATQGTIITNFVSPNGPSATGNVAVSFNTSALNLFTTPSGNGELYSGSGIITSNNITYGSGAIAKLGFTYNGTAVNVALNAGTVASGTLTIPVLTQLWLGSATGNQFLLNGWLQSFSYYNTALTATQLQQQTQ